MRQRRPYRAGLGDTTVVIRHHTAAIETLRFTLGSDERVRPRLHPGLGIALYRIDLLPQFFQTLGRRRAAVVFVEFFISLLRRHPVTALELAVDLTCKCLNGG